MRRRKKCRCCGKLYHPHPQTHRRQKTCNKSVCRKKAQRQKWRGWKRKHPWRGERYHAQQQSWRERNPGYWRDWRSKRPGYVRRNRRKQRRRNRENRGLIAKPTAWNRVRIENLRRIHRLRMIAKPTASPAVLGLVIDGILRHLAGQELIAKPTDMDFSS